MSAPMIGTMAITLKSVNLGYMGLMKGLLAKYPEFAEVPYQCPAIAYIIEHPDGRILWETGVSANGVAEWLPAWQELVDLSNCGPEQCLESRLHEFGLGPEDFRYVVMGHLHTDHAGGLRIFADANVDIVLHADEYAHVTSMEEESANFFAKVDFACLDGMNTVQINDDGTELMSGITLHHLPGHTPGQMGMLVQLEHTGPVLLTSDALYLHDSYGPPAVGSDIVHDADAWAHSVEKLRNVALEQEALIFPGHDEVGIKQFKDRTEPHTVQFWPGYEYS